MERGWETSMCVCLSSAPYWGPGPQPRQVPWLGIEPATLWFTGQHSIHWATPARTLPFFNFTFIMVKKMFLLLLKVNAHTGMLDFTLFCILGDPAQFSLLSQSSASLSLLSFSHQPLPYSNLYYSKIILQHHAFSHIHFCHSQGFQRVDHPSCIPIHRCTQPISSTVLNEMPRSLRTSLLLSSKNTFQFLSFLIFLKHITWMDIFFPS